jgi:UDP-N-acetylmuramate dehydrogenase
MSTGLDTVADRLEVAFGARMERDASSASLTTYRCGGPLAVLVRVAQEAELGRVGEALARDTPVLVVGRGSNLLVADDGYAGVAIVLDGEFEQLAIDRDAATVTAGAAVALPVLARQAGAAGVSALEFFVGIPGSVGGAIRMNAGGHGADTDEVVRRARVFDLDDGSARDLERDALGLGYRCSALGPRTVVVAASFQGRPDDPEACARRIDEIVRWRREHQPGGQNAGSVFTNPPGDAAGRLIDATGLKGLRIGGAVVSDKHANFFVADPGARAGDVHALVCEVRRRVEAATGVRLEPELRFVGFPRKDEESGR